MPTITVVMAILIVGGFLFFQKVSSIDTTGKSDYADCVVKNADNPDTHVCDYLRNK